MQIITNTDTAFADLLQAWKEGLVLGKYWRNGRVQIVCATRQFLLVGCDESPSKIAIKPTRGLSESQNLGRQLLTREGLRGNKVELAEQPH